MTTTTFWRDATKVRRTCSRCGDPWIAGQWSCPRCRSIMFDEQPEAPKIPEDSRRSREVEGWETS